MPDSLLIAGHTLVNEGASFLLPRCEECQALPPGRVRDRQGHAQCSCGEWSEHLPSTAQRKQWHRDHKNAVAVSRSGMNHVCPDNLRTERAKRIEELVTILGRVKSRERRSRADWENLADHLMHLRMHRLCPSCGYPLDNTSPHPAARVEVVADAYKAAYAGAKKTTHKSLAVTG